MRRGAWILPVFLLLFVGWALATTPGSAFTLGFLVSRSAGADVRMRSSSGSFVTGFRAERIEISAAKLKGRVRARTLVISPLVPFPPRVTASGVEYESAEYGSWYASRIEGRLSALRFRDVSGAHPKLPRGSRIRIQTLTLSLPATSRSFKRIDNGRLELPSSDPVFFYGMARGDQVNLHLYAKLLSFDDVLAPYVPARWKALKGAFANVEARVTGAPASARVDARFRVADVSRGWVKLPHAFVRVEAARLKDGWKGAARVPRGKVYVRTTPVKLESSSVSFAPSEPLRLDFSARSTVGDTQITIRIEGTPEKPSLAARSFPPHDQDQLLMMLITGRDWEATGKALKEGKISVNLAAEFVDYFLFGGSGGSLATKLGLREISLQYDETSRGMEVKKGLFGSVDAVLGMEQPQNAATGPTTQKVGAEYRLRQNATVALEAKKEKRAAALPGEDTETDPGEARSVTVSYQSKF